MLYLFLADGFEEVEAISALDVIRRAGLKVSTVGVTGDVVCGTHGVEVKADCTEVDYNDIEGVILPGGMPGTLNLQKSEMVNDALRFCRDNNRLIAAICAAPMILGELGYLDGRDAVCFPGFEDSLAESNIKSDGVVCDGNYITAKGAGAALEFGAAIVDYIAPAVPSKGMSVLKKMQVNI